MAVRLTKRLRVRSGSVASSRSIAYQQAISNSTSRQIIGNNLFLTFCYTHHHYYIICLYCRNAGKTTPAAPPGIDYSHLMGVDASLLRESMFVLLQKISGRAPDTRGLRHISPDLTPTGKRSLDSAALTPSAASSPLLYSAASTLSDVSSPLHLLRKEPAP